MPKRTRNTIGLEILVLYTKKEIKDCSNYRCFNAIASTGRLYGRVLRKEECKEQSGFRAGRSYADNLFCVKQLIEKSSKALEFVSKLNKMAIDLRKAYDNVPIKRLWDHLNQNRFHPQYKNATKNFYKRNVSIAMNRRNIEVDSWQNKKNGVRFIICIIYTDDNLQTNGT